jgi:hypothetical protein
MDITLNDELNISPAISSPSVPERILQNPYWVSKEHRHVMVEFFYPQTNKRVLASIKDDDGSNPDFQEVMAKYTIEHIDGNTQKRKTEREKHIRQNIERDKVNKMKAEQEMLFTAKLEAFEIPLVKNSKNKLYKSKIRKAKSIMEVTAYTAILLMKEEDVNDAPPVVRE